MKFVSWNASPSARAGPTASSIGTDVPRMGSICNPITAAEPYMYSDSSAIVRYRDRNAAVPGMSIRIECRNA
ncbi:hypothetical protein A6409_11185 [Prescottella equi]|nr:hypothetical protein A6409_11185 [Prescottella equi]